MKKTLIILAAVLLIAGLFIACSADINSADETASVSFGNGAKGLSYTTTPADLPDVNSLIWWYKATKSGDSGAAGTTPGWTRINPSGTGLATTLTGFKIGSGWTFTIAGKKAAETDTEPTSGYTDCVYYGTNDAVILRRGNNTININLTWVAPTSATVSFSNIAVYESDAYFDSSDTWKILEGESVKASGSFTAWTNKISTTTPIVAEVGSHTYTVKVYDNAGDSPAVIATQSVTVYAYPGSTITVTGSIDNLNVSADVDINTNYNDLAIWKSGASEPEMMSLAEFRDKVNSNVAGYSTATVVLNRDVDLKGSIDNQWNPIGSKQDANPSSFNGVFDGANHTIRNMYIGAVGMAENGGSYAALFAVVQDATIKNLTVEGTVEFTGSVSGVVGRANGSKIVLENINNKVNITGTSNAAGLIALANTTGPESSTITNCVNDGTINSVGGFHAGGLIGKSNGSLVFINCVNNGDVTYTGNSSAGGFCAAPYGGDSSTITFINCQNRGNITAIGTGQSANAGGFIGGHSGMSGTMIIKTDSTRADYTDEKATANYGIISAGNGAGGFVGSVWSPVEITDVINYGEIRGAAAGGIVGINETEECSVSVINSQNIVAIESNRYFTYGTSKYSMAGGIIGAFRSSGSMIVANCSGGTASISSTASGVDAYYVGRLLGDLSHGTSAGTSANLTINNENGDDNSIGMIGIVGLRDNEREATILSGRLIANPAKGQTYQDNNLIFKAGTSWDKNGDVTNYSVDTIINLNN